MFKKCEYRIHVTTGIKKAMDSFRREKIKNILGSCEHKRDTGIDLFFNQDSEISVWPRSLEITTNSEKNLNELLQNTLSVFDYNPTISKFTADYIIILKDESEIKSPQETAKYAKKFEKLVRLNFKKDTIPINADFIASYEDRIYRITITLGQADLKMEVSLLNVDLTNIDDAFYALNDFIDNVIIKDINETLAGDEVNDSSKK